MLVSILVSFDSYFRFMVGLLLAVMAVLVVRALLTGRIKTSGDLYLRTEHPSEYWMEVLTFASMVAIGAVILAWLWDSRPGSLILLAVFVPQIGRTLWTGRIPLGSGLRYDRTDSPVAYWTIMTTGLILCAFYVGLNLFP